MIRMSFACIAAVLISALSAPSAMAQKNPPRAGHPAGHAPPSSQPADDKGPKNKAVVALRMVVDNAEFDAMPFDDFVDWLGRTTGADVLVRWKVLEKAGIDRDHPITLKQKEITIGKLLPLVFDQLTENDRELELAAKADGNVLIITTRADLNSKLVVKMYDIQTLLVSAPNFQGGRLNTDNIGQRNGMRTGSVVKQPDQPATKEKTVDERTQRLIDAITSTIEPDSWKVNGGRGTISVFKNKLAIRNSEEVHELITAMLGGGPAGGSSKGK